MKKLSVTMIIVLLSAITVFCIGWLPLRVPAGLSAVLVSKTGGVHAAVLSPGSFFWSPEALLPTNIKLYTFKSATLEQKIDLNGEMPSAAAYRAFLAGEPDFSWQLSLRLAASVNPGYLPKIVSGFGVQDDAGLADWLRGELARAAEDLRPILVAAAADPAKAQGLVSGALSSSLMDTVQAKRPALAIREVSVLSSRMPDLALYESARALYSGYMESYRAMIEPVLAEASKKAAGDQVRLDSLKRYGKLLSEYPSLVDLLAIEAGIAPRQLPAVK